MPPEKAFRIQRMSCFDDDRGPRKEDVDNELSKPGFGYPDRNLDEDK